MTKVLLIVDVQNDFMPGGSLPIENGLKIIPSINKLINSGKFDKVIASQDWHPTLKISDTPGKSMGRCPITEAYIRKQFNVPQVAA